MPKSDILNHLDAIDQALDATVAAHAGDRVYAAEDGTLSATPVAAVAADKQRFPNGYLDATGTAFYDADRIATLSSHLATVRMFVDELRDDDTPASNPDQPAAAAPAPVDAALAPTAG